MGLCWMEIPFLATVKQYEQVNKIMLKYEEPFKARTNNICIISGNIRLKN